MIAPPAGFRIDGLRLRNPLNGSHGNWRAVAERRKHHRSVSRLSTQAHARHLFMGQKIPPTDVTIIRVSPGVLDDDSLPAACKSVRDGIADAFGITDGPTGPIVWHYGQKKEGPGVYAVEIKIVPRHDK